MKPEVRAMHRQMKADLARFYGPRHEVSDMSQDDLSPPGVLIETLMKEKGYDDVTASVKMGFDIRRLTKDDPESLTGDMAYRLAAVLGHSMTFWVQRESQYRIALRREMWR